jgi:hypothetical protein
MHFAPLATDFAPLAVDFHPLASYFLSLMITFCHFSKPP